MNDLRAVLASMLGIPVTSTRTLDFEMISRIEKLILTCSNHTTNSLLIDPERSLNMAQKYKRTQINSDNEGFNASYGNDLVNNGINNGGFTGRNNRSRSFSPKKRFDTRIF